MGGSLLIAHYCLFLLSLSRIQEVVAETISSGGLRSRFQIRLTFYSHFLLPSSIQEVVTETAGRLAFDRLRLVCFWL